MGNRSAEWPNQLTWQPGWGRVKRPRLWMKSSRSQQLWKERESVFPRLRPLAGYCISYFSGAEIKCHKQRWLEEKRVYFGWQFSIESMMTGKAGQQTAENRNHISIDTQEVEIANYTWSSRINSPSLTPVGHFLQQSKASQSFQNLLKQHYQQGTRWSNTWAYWDSLHLSHQFFNPKWSALKTCTCEKYSSRL